MKLLNNKTHIYGFEDYNIISLYEGCFIHSYDFRIPYYFENSAGSYIINKDLPVCVRNKPDLQGWYNTVEFDLAICENHKELLSAAEKLYVHPNCKLSRSMLAERYKKSLNPWLSDAVVVPDYDPYDLSLCKKALFMHEQSKMIISVKLDDEELVNKSDNWEMGAEFRNFALGRPDTHYGHEKSINSEDILDAKLFYVGEVLYVPNSCSFITEILTNRLPIDKIVSEKSVQESLGSETNQLDFDSLTSIKDMLDSSDENTVAAGLKSLSMMDWMHYPNSIKYVLGECDRWKWKYNKAADSTSVKYMLKTISRCSTRRHWPGRMDDEIYEQDYELFKQLKMYYERIEESNILFSISTYNFMGVSPLGVVCPRLKTS